MTDITPKTTLAWRKFLQSPEGQNGMLFLREKTPGVTIGDSHNIIFSAGRSEGYKNAIDTMSEILAMPQAKDIEIENK